MECTGRVYLTTASVMPLSISNMSNKVSL